MENNAIAKANEIKEELTKLADCYRAMYNKVCEQFGCTSDRATYYRGVIEGLEQSIRTILNETIGTKLF